MLSVEGILRQPEKLGSNVRRFTIGVLAILGVLIALLLASPDGAATERASASEMGPAGAPASDPFAPRTNRELDVLGFVKLALAVKDPKAAVPGFVGDRSRPLRSTASARDYFLDFDNFFAKAAQTQTLRPIFQAHADRLARFAMVTSWGGNGTKRSDDIAPVTIFLKTLYCRRVGCDLYFGTTAEVLGTVGVTVTDDRYSMEPLLRYHQWVKPVMVTTYLPHYEWVVWQDPDILPIDMDWSIFDFVRSGGGFDSADFIAGYEFDRVPFNTGQYYAKRSTFSFQILHASWSAPNHTWGNANDQGALFWAYHDMSPQIRSRAAWTLLREMGSWIFGQRYSDSARRFRYHDPTAHFSYCNDPQYGATHLAIVALALSGMYTGSPPPDLFYFTRPRPTVIGARTFNVTFDSRKHADALEDGSIAVVTLPPTAPSPIHHAIRDSWVKYCTEMGYAFEEAPLQNLWVPYEEKRHPTKMRWRAVQEVLPYYSWVVYVDPDVAIATAKHRLSALIKAQQLRAPGRAVDWIAAPLGDKNLSGAAFVVRRTSWALNLLEELYYDEGADYNAAVANVFPPLDRLPLGNISSDRRGDKNPKQAWTEDFSRVEITRLVAMPTSLCRPDDVVTDCTFESRGHWFVRLPLSACSGEVDGNACSKLVAK